MQQHAEWLLALLGDPSVTESQWQQRYEQHEEALAAAISDGVEACRKTLLEVMLSFGEFIKLFVKLQQMGESSQLLCRALYEALAGAAGLTCSSDQQLQQRQRVQADDEDGGPPSAAAAVKSTSSSSSSSSGSACSGVARAGASPGATAAAGAEQQIEQLLNRLLLHAATLNVMPGGAAANSELPGLLSLFKALQAAVEQAISMPAVLLPPLPTNSSGSGSRRNACSSSSSSVSLVRLHTSEVLRSHLNLVMATSQTLAKLTALDSPLVKLAQFVNAGCLGVLACMGLWHPPLDSKGLPPCRSHNSETEAAEYAFVSSVMRLLGSSCGDSSSSDSDSWAEHSLQLSRMLMKHAMALRSEDLAYLAAVLHGACWGAGEGSSPQSMERWICGGFGRGRLQQLVQQHCNTAAAAAAAEIQPMSLQKTEASSGTAGEPVKDVKLQQHALWRLLLAVKPSVAAALHCSSLPAACRSYEAFEGAVLAWPPQPAAAADAQQEHSSSGGGGGSSCSCGKPGYAYTAGAVGSTAPADHDDAAHQRAVCADPACVARELQQLAQLGPPAAGLGGEHVRSALQQALEDVVLLPTEFR
jgi:hypothetical protein